VLEYEVEVLRIRRAHPLELTALRNLLCLRGRDRWALAVGLDLGNDYFALVFSRPCACASVG
jgi:hypothetical protein